MGSYFSTKVKKSIVNNLILNLLTLVEINKPRSLKTLLTLFLWR